MSKIKEQPKQQNPVLRTKTNEKKLKNGERESVKKMKMENLNKRIKKVEAEKDWRDLISDKKLEEVANRLPQKLWSELSFHKQLLNYLERKRLGVFQGAYI